MEMYVSFAIGHHIFHNSWKSRFLDRLEMLEFDFLSIYWYLSHVYVERNISYSISNNFVSKTCDIYNRGSGCGSGQDLTNIFLKHIFVYDEDLWLYIMYSVFLGYGKSWFDGRRSRGGEIPAKIGRVTSNDLCFCFCSVKILILLKFLSASQRFSAF